MNKIKTFLTGRGIAPRAIGSTILMCTKQIFDGDILCIAGEYLVAAVQFVMLVFIWLALDREGADLGGMALGQLLTYTLMASILHQELNIISPATASLWEGSVIGRFTRPLPVPISFMAETVGRWWIPNFLFFGLPLWLAAPLLGINPWPAKPVLGLLTLVSLGLSAALGFAVDLLFAALAIHLKNGCWAALAVREAAYALLSGEMIPFALFPFGLDRLFALSPFGSIGHAPLTIYIGASPSTAGTIGLQLFWTVVLWFAAARVFKKSRERMISYGG